MKIYSITPYNLDVKKYSNNKQLKQSDYNSNSVQASSKLPSTMQYLLEGTALIWNKQ